MLPFRSGRARTLSAAGVFLSLGFLLQPAFAADAKTKAKKEKTPGAITNLPLPVGQEAKGLVLPDFDAGGHLRSRSEAEAAKRTDNEHIRFTSLKMTTFNQQNAVELQIHMPVSVLDLTTHVITSEERTTVKRSDFDLAGDRMRFDTVAKKGTLTGNVKMVITDQTDLQKKKTE